MKRFSWFETPMQVLWFDCDAEEEEEYKAGIAYHDKIICACCSGVMEIDEIYQFAEEADKVGIVPFDNWIDLTDEITGSLSREEVYEIIRDEGLAED